MYGEEIMKRSEECEAICKSEIIGEIVWLGFGYVRKLRENEDK